MTLLRAPDGNAFGAMRKKTALASARPAQTRTRARPPTTGTDAAGVRSRETDVARTKRKTEREPMPAPNNAVRRPALIRTIQARDYRNLRHVDVRLDQRFQVLVGPNGSGKSTLFDVIAFVFDLIATDLEAAVAKRTRNFQDLVWRRPPERPGFEIAVEFELSQGSFFRYEIAVGETDDGVRLTDERAFLGRLTADALAALARTDTVFSDVSSKILEPVFRRVDVKDDEGPGPGTTFFLERSSGNERATLYHTNTASINLVPVVDQFREPDEKGGGALRPFAMPTAAAAVRQLQKTSVQSVQLDSRRLRMASQPNGDDGLTIAPDGRNLPWVLKSFRKRHRKLFLEWIRHLGTALEDVSDIRTVRREDDRHAYLMIRYADDVEVPSWGVSEGTLRLIVLTLLAYLPNDTPTVYLLEEPENGIHPMAIETAYQSLSSVYDAQVFIASHSPTFLRCVTPEQVLCCARNSSSGAVITPGRDNPMLSAWQESVDNDLLFASGVLG